MKRFDEILQREMTRKEFVAQLGLALLALIGLPGLIGVFGKVSKSAEEPKDGFGSGTYR